MVKQIVVKTKESDIQEFYVGILGGKITRHFTLNEKDAIRIYNIPQQLEVYELKLQNIRFELVVCEVFEQDSLQHVCLQLDNTSEVFTKALERHYWTHLRKSSKPETYFIKDKNNNLFELKTKLQYHEQQF